MFSFWYELPRVLRLVFSLVLIGVAVLIFLLTGGSRIAIGLGVFGLVTLLFNGAGGNSGGYNF